MSNVKEKDKRERKLLSDKEKRKNVTITFSPKILRKLTEDAEDGKARSLNQMVTKIVEMYYKNRDKKEKQRHPW